MNEGRKMEDMDMRMKKEAKKLRYKRKLHVHSITLQSTI